MISEQYSKEAGNFLKLAGISLLMLSLFLGVLTINAIKEFGTIGNEVYPTKTLSVTADGEVLAAPDVAQFSFTVTEEAGSISEAQGVVTEKIDAALETLAELGVEEKDIKTTNYNAYPRYSYPEIACLGGSCPPRERVLTGYEVSQTISVKVRDAEQAGEALSKVAGAGISNVSGLQFVIDDEENLRAEAREKAIANAEEKINKLAQDLGVKVKSVVSFSEDMGGYYPYEERAAMSSVGFGGDSIQELSAPKLPAGENTVRVRVYVTYEIK